MSYESNTGLGVATQYGSRAAGGTEGVVKTEGVRNEFLEDLDADQLDFGFPSTDGSAWVTMADVSQLGGTITAISIGGVVVTAATPEAPVNIPAGNTGVIVYTGSDGSGKALIAYNKYPL